MRKEREREKVQTVYERKEKKKKNIKWLHELNRKKKKARGYKTTAAKETLNRQLLDELFASGPTQVDKLGWMDAKQTLGHDRKCTWHSSPADVTLEGL